VQWAYVALIPGWQTRWSEKNTSLSRRRIFQRDDYIGLSFSSVRPRLTGKLPYLVWARSRRTQGLLLSQVLSPEIGTGLPQNLTLSPDRCPPYSPSSPAILPSLTLHRSPHAYSASPTRTLCPCPARTLSRTPFSLALFLALTLCHCHHRARTLSHTLPPLPPFLVTCYIGSVPSGAR
jgi:hypothetical protein